MDVEQISVNCRLVHCTLLNLLIQEKECHIYQQQLTRVESKTSEQPHYGTRKKRGIQELSYLHLRKRV